MLSYVARLARAGLLTVAVLVVGPRVAAAQSSFSVAAGASIPTGDFGKSRDVGYHALAGPPRPAPVRRPGRYHPPLRAPRSRRGVKAPRTHPARTARAPR